MQDKKRTKPAISATLSDLAQRSIYEEPRGRDKTCTLASQPSCSENSRTRKNILEIRGANREKKIENTKTFHREMGESSLVLFVSGCLIRISQSLII